MVAPTDPVLVASASSNTGGNAVQCLSAKGHRNIRALFRNTENENAKLLASLPGVTIVKGDFDDRDSIMAALRSVKRVMLVANSNLPGHFHHETNFMDAANEEGVEVIVRVGTSTAQTNPTTPVSYGRSHFSVESYANWHKLPVISLRPNWFLDNFLPSGEEAKATGKITYPASCNGMKHAQIDPRDVGAAAAFILGLSLDKLSPLVRARTVEVHGPDLVSMKDVFEELSAVYGYTISVNEVTHNEWVSRMVGFGMEKTLAEDIAHTVKILNGDSMAYCPFVQHSSVALTKLGWQPRYSYKDWVRSEKVKAAFSK